MTTAIATPLATPLAIPGAIPSGTAYDAAAHAAATRAAYTSDAQCWGRWLEGEGVNATDATPRHVAAYLAHLADTGHAAATIDRRLVAIRALYRAAGLEDPTKSEAVATRRRGIRRTIGTAQREARPVLLEDLSAMLRTLPATLLGARDRALLLVGFAGAFRRAELAGIRAEDLEWSDRGVVVRIPFSKTNQEGSTETVAIPFARVVSRCPVRALRAWLEAAGIASGPVFRSVNRHGQVSSAAITPRSVDLIIKRTAEAAGMDTARLSGHSLRSGLATAAALEGVDERSIMRQTRHRSVAMVRRYIRQAEQWTNNAAGAVL